jgi:regulatory protein
MVESVMSLSAGVSRSMTDRSDEGAKARPVDKAYLRRAALAYLQRYASSAQNLHRVLARKAQRRQRLGAEPPTDLAAMIEEVVAEAMRMDLVDDRRFADARVATLLRQGTSRRGLQVRLAAKGVEREVVQNAIADADPDETASARRLAQRRRLGPWRDPPDPLKRSRDLAVLQRAGFSHGVARAVIDGSADSDP